MLFALVGFTCLTCGLYGLVSSTQFLFSSEIITGIVKKTERAPSGRTKSYNIVVEYQNNKGMLNQVKSSVPSFPPPAGIGDKVFVAINRDTSEARIAMFSDFYLGNLIATLVGAFFLVFIYGERILSAVLTRNGR